jgi:hypothetical protein
MSDQTTLSKEGLREYNNINSMTSLLNSVTYVIYGYRNGSNITIYIRTFEILTEWLKIILFMFQLKEENIRA